jgi:thioredoxin-related protein
MKSPIIAVVSSVALAAAAFASDGWLVDFEKAKAQAAAEKKDLLIDFTGSDWCSWCIRLRKEVFDEEAFKKAAPGQFVLVELDFPQDTSKQPETVRKQNEALRDAFGIEGYPSIVLADATGRPYAQTGYQKGGAAAYLKHLDELRGKLKARDAAFKRAESASGIEKAKALQEGLSEVPDNLVAAHYRPTLQQIRSLDPEDTLGVDARFGAMQAMRQLGEVLKGKQQAGGAAVREEADRFLGEYPKFAVRQKQQVLMQVLNFLMPPKDNKVALKLMEDVKALDPETEEGKMAEQIRSKVEKMMAK